MATGTVRLTADLPACCALLWPWHRVAVGGGTLSRSTGTRSFTTPSGVHLLHTVALVSLGPTRAASGHHDRVVVVWCGTAGAHQQAQPQPHHQRPASTQPGRWGATGLQLRLLPNRATAGQHAAGRQQCSACPAPSSLRCGPLPTIWGHRGKGRGVPTAVRKASRAAPYCSNPSLLLQSILTAPIHLHMELSPPKPPSTQAMAPQWKGHSQSLVATARPLLAHN
ncbi:hypothetical protein V8C86DRAFT_1660452 [Haematococcus lacustris]